MTEFGKPDNIEHISRTSLLKYNATWRKNSFQPQSYILAGVK